MGKQVCTLAALLALVAAPLASAEPGTEYVFDVNETTSYLELDVGGGGTVTGDAPLDGWISVFIDDPNENPADWNVKVILGRSQMEITEDLLMVIPIFGSALVEAGNIVVYDMDVWYSDPNDWEDPNDAPDPNTIAPGDPNDPNYNNPDDPSLNRWANLIGGDPATGQLNSEILYYWNFVLFVNGGDPNDPNDVVEADSDFTWSDPFEPWTVTMSDAADPNLGDVDIVVEWVFWILSGGDRFIQGTVHIEATGGIGRSLEIINNSPDRGSVTVDPNYPRIDTFPSGSTVTLTAVPEPDRGFKEWKIFDPNFPGDSNYITRDSNAVLDLVMDGDYQVEAVFTCGSGLPPFVAMALLALGLGVVIRRLS